MGHSLSLAAEQRGGGAVCQPVLGHGLGHRRGLVSQESIAIQQFENETNNKELGVSFLHHLSPDCLAIIVSGVTRADRASLRLTSQL